jgi:hypothetical protein
MEMPFCNECGDFMFSSGHRCPPVFLCIEESDIDAESDDTSHWAKVRAIDEGMAAENIAERWDEDNDLCRSGAEMIVLVVEDGKPRSEAKKFTVTAEATVEYTASEKD